jgi:MYXO-CTERM domain-containing protein
MSRRQALLAASLPLAGLFGAAFLLDLFDAASTSSSFLYRTAALGVLAVGAAWAWSRRAECLVPLLPFATLLAILPLVDTSPLKPFGRFYAVIEPGMTAAEVLKALDDEFPPTCRYPKPVVNRKVGPNHLGFILDPKNGAYDAVIVAVDFEAGRVVRKQYYPD